ncbi:MAG: hypothetical protein AAGK78_17410, partial [Planctomycetota bacterium]
MRGRPAVPPPPRINPRASGAPSAFSDTRITGQNTSQAALPETERRAPVAPTCTGYRFARPKWENTRPSTPKMKKPSKPGTPAQALPSSATPSEKPETKAAPAKPVATPIESAVDDVLTRHGIFKGWERIAVPHGTVFCDLLLAHDDRLTGRPVLIEWVVELPAIVDDPAASEARQIML